MEGHPLTPEERFAEFQRHIGKQCTSLDDLDWDSIKAFLERIPSAAERVDFLGFISRLPDNGVVNDTVVDPARHHRNTEAIRRPLDQERTRLLSQHFDLQRIRQTAEQIPNHLEAAAYLRGILESYIDYHPTIRQGSYSPAELTFVKTIESKIQLRKDMHAASSQSSSMPTNEQDAVARAIQLYEEVKKLANGEKPLDKNSARLIIELADDAIKEFGNTNQERKVELRKLKTEAEDFLPSPTLEELRKKAEGKAISLLHPANRVWRILLYTLILLSMIAAAVFGLLRSFPTVNETTKGGPSPTPLPTEPPAQTSGIGQAPTSITTQTPSDSSEGLKATLLNHSLYNNKMTMKLVLVNSSTRQVLVNDLFPIIYRSEETDPSDTGSEETDHSDMSGGVTGYRPSVDLENVKTTPSFPTIIKPGEILQLTITASFNPAKYYGSANPRNYNGPLKSIEETRTVQIGVRCCAVDSNGLSLQTENPIFNIEVTKSGDYSLGRGYKAVNLFQGHFASGC